MHRSLKTLFLIAILLVSIQPSTICPFCLPIDHCTDQQDMTCKSCDPGYDLIDNQCKKKSSTQIITSASNIANCMNQQGAKCSQCVPGYDLIGNRCLQKN